MGFVIDIRAVVRTLAHGMIRNVASLAELIGETVMALTTMA